MTVIKVSLPFVVTVICCPTVLLDKRSAELCVVEIWSVLHEQYEHYSLIKTGHRVKNGQSGINTDVLQPPTASNVHKMAAVNATSSQDPAIPTITYTHTHTHPKLTRIHAHTPPTHKNTHIHI